MPKPAFIIEGEMEKRVVQQLCPGSVVRRLEVNGRDVAIEAIAKRVDTLIRLLGNRVYPIVILFDREGRTESCQTLVRQLSNMLDGMGHATQYRIGIADRNIESWILADWQKFFDMIGEEEGSRQQVEGMNGKAKLRLLLPPDMSYHETTLGVKLLQNCRTRVLYENSASFRAFVDQLSDINCLWLDGCRD